MSQYPHGRKALGLVLLIVTYHSVSLSRAINSSREVRSWSPVGFQSNSKDGPFKEAVTCTVNRDAPPAGPYRWPANATIRVFFIREMFTPDQQRAMQEAMSTWTNLGYENGSGVRFTGAGETITRMGCQGCLTIGRRDVYRRDHRYYALFNPIEGKRGLLFAAWIDFDFGITRSKALKSFMLHELAHGLGLWDCTTCKRKLTVMNGFLGPNTDNGLVKPTKCDLAAVRDIYQSAKPFEAVELMHSQRSEIAPLAGEREGEWGREFLQLHQREIVQPQTTEDWARSAAGLSQQGDFNRLRSLIRNKIDSIVSPTSSCCTKMFGAGHDIFRSGFDNHN